MKVYFDIDGVLADFDAVIRKSIRETFPDKQFHDEVASCWNIDEAYRITSEEMIEAWTGSRFLSNLASAPVVPIGLEILNAFKNLDDLCLLTSRSTGVDEIIAQDIQDITMNWLEAPLNRIGIRDIPTVEFNNDKVNFAVEKGYTVAVEDAPHHVELLLKAGLQVMMPVWPYNKHLVGLKGLIPIIR